MGYDYTRKFLEANAATMNQLTELYNSQGIVSIAYDTVEDMNAKRYQVSNVMVSMAHHFPAQYVDLRKRLRTWTEWDSQKEQWILHIGAPRHKISGRKPGLLPTRPREVYGPAAQTGSPTERYGQLISTEEEFETFAKWVATVGAATTRIEAELIEPPDNDQFLKVFQAVGWETELDGPTTIVLKRPRRQA